MSNTTTSISPNASAFGEAPIRAGASSFSRPAALIGGATVLVALTAIATTLVVRSPGADAQGQARAGAPVAAQALLPQEAKTAAAGAVAANDGDDQPAPKDAQPAKSTAPAKPAPRPAAKPQAAQPAQATPERVASVCNTCGVVEAVTPFQQKGEGTGLGAVAGGVIGGVIGNQMGGGSGKKAMTVLGAVGGGVAGHEIEKRQRATTLYSVKVRMEDGSLRTVTQSTAPTVGQKVTVEGSQIKARA